MKNFTELQDLLGMVAVATLTFVFIATVMF
jgi:hypothetical protein